MSFIGNPSPVHPAQDGYYFSGFFGWRLPNTSELICAATIAVSVGGPLVFLFDRCLKKRENAHVHSESSENRGSRQLLAKKKMD